MDNYKIVSHAGAGLPLNVATTTTISRRTNVNIWSDTGSNDQKWSITSLGTSLLAHNRSGHPACPIECYVPTL